MQNCQALSMSVSYIMYSGSSMKSIHIKHLENLRDSARGGVGIGGENQDKFLSALDMKRGSSSLAWAFCHEHCFG